MRNVLVILGSTATGKTDLALDLAKKFNGELVSCDSRQVYKGLDVGTGKMPAADLRFKINDLRLKKGNKWWGIDGVKIWMYDVVSPKSQYTVADYVKDAEKIIREIDNRGKLAIVVGGTGLYLKALLYGLSNLAIPIDKKLRQGLEKLSLAKLQETLQKISFSKWEGMNKSDQANPRRLIRAIEIEIMDSRLRGNDKTKVENNNWFGLKSRYDVLKIGLIAPREILYKKADKRVISRINQGMIDEAKRLHNKGLSFKRMRELGLEYGVLADFLEGGIKNRKELIEILQGKIHGFIRRQITWFKKEKSICWVDITEKNFDKEVENIVTKWYYPS